jgi:hypothetical protein
VPPAPGDDAEQDLRLTELGVVTGDAEVAAQRELAAAAERVAGDAATVGLGIRATAVKQSCSAPERATMSV